MSRIDARFASLKAEGKSAFVSFVMAGDLDYETSMAIVRGLPAVAFRARRVRRRRCFWKSDDRP